MNIIASPRTTTARTVDQWSKRITRWIGRGILSLLALTGGLILIGASCEAIIDPCSEYVEDHMTAQAAKAEAAESQQFYQILGSIRSIGIVRLIWASSWPSVLPVTAKLPYQLRDLLGVLQSRPQHIETALAENAAAAQNNDLLHNASLGKLPLVVLGSGTLVERNPYWHASLEYQAALSANSRLTIIPGSDHSIHWQDPALVITTVRDVITAAQTNQSLTPAGTKGNSPFARVGPFRPCQ